MDVLTIFEDLSLTLGHPNTVNLPTEVRARILAEINATSQIVAKAPKEFFLREEETVVTVGGTKSYTLSTDVMSVLGDLRDSNGEALHAIPTRSQFENYGPLYGGQLTRAITNGKPKAYFIDSGKSALAESGSDFTELVLHVWPTPDAVYSLTLDVKKTPPVFTLDDLAGTQHVIWFSLNAAPANASYATIYGCRGSLVIWFGSGAEPAEKLIEAKAADEYIYVNTATWSSGTTGATLLAAALATLYPVTFVSVNDADEVYVTLGAKPFTAATLTGVTNMTINVSQTGVLPTAIPAPHGFIESIFLPIARHRLTTFYRYFTDHEAKEDYARQAAAAYAAVGLDPALMGINLDPQQGSVAK